MSLLTRSTRELAVTSPCCLPLSLSVFTANHGQARDTGTMSTLPLTLPFDPSASLLINGHWTTGHTTFAVLDPATDQVIAHVADGEPDTALEALAGACDAQSVLAKVRPQVRSDFLRELYSLLLDHADQLCAVITAESGKPLGESRAELSYGADYVRWYSEEALRIHGQSGLAPAGHNLFTTMRPVGPSLLVTPWNFPLAMLTRKFAPAFSAGCTTLIKPASATPLTALYFAHLVNTLVEKYELPPATLSVLTTSQSGPLSQALLSDARLRKLSFTGSTTVGSTLLGLSAPNIVRTSMELGGNAPFIVCADADLDSAVQGAMAAKMRNAGQTCVAANRFYVHSSLIAQFTEKLSLAFAELVVGQGTQPDVSVGPLINSAATDSVDALVDEALNAGAEIHFRSDIETNGAGNFYPPTILTNVSADNPITKAEIFGPVAPITSFEHNDQVIEWANNTTMGLCAYAYSSSLSTVAQLTSQLECGILGINTGIISDAAAPFGGIKQSGLGREGGQEGILEYLTTQYIALHTN